MAKTNMSVVFLTAAVEPGPRAAPFGAARVASALKAALAGSVRVRIVEGFARDSAESLATKALETAPDIVGLSLYSWNSRLLESAGALIKARQPHIMIVAGGPDASANPDRLAAGGVADIVVSGEGEGAMADIVSSMLRGEVPPGPVIRAPLLDPADLPSPWLDGTLDASRWGGAALELTRGCPYRCSFCFESKGTARLRHFPLDTIRKEVERFSEAGVDEVFVLDPTFNADARRMAGAVRVFQEAGPDLRYMIELRAELLGARQAELLSSINCAVQIGLQSADAKVLANVNRSIDPDIFTAKLALLDEAGILYGLDLIYGLPGDTLAGFRRSLDFALDRGPNHLDVFRLAVLPGTALADDAARLGLEHDQAAPYLVRSAPGFPAQDLATAETLARATDLFYTNGRAVMWFRAVAALLRSRPSALLIRFAEWAAAQPDPGPDASHATLEAMQIGFLSAWLTEKPPRGNPAVREVTLDLVHVSGAWTRAMAEGEQTTLELGWEPEDLLDYASADIEDFASEYKRSSGRWLCLPGEDGPLFRRAAARRGGKA
ncbi:MAG TPA: B12-binding domain-containing radical SAM protein [bacterium]|nr:B12-binding domain-containing radical SAM protein [bacterium]